MLFSCSVLWVWGFVLSVLGLVDWACCRGLGGFPLGAPDSKPPAPLPISQQTRINQNYWGWGWESLLKEGVGPWGWAPLLIDLLLGGWVVFLWREVWGGASLGWWKGMALFVLLGVQKVVFGFGYFIPVFVFVFLGPGAQSGFCSCSEIWVLPFWVLLLTLF